MVRKEGVERLNTFLLPIKIKVRLGMLKHSYCLFCRNRFLVVNFLSHRLKGYCTEGCMAHTKRTPVSDVDNAYRNGFRLKRTE